MTVTHCDRCGKIIDKDTLLMIGNPRQFIIPFTKYKILKSNPLTYETDTVVDLCPECQEKLDVWLKEGKSKED